MATSLLASPLLVCQLTHQNPSTPWTPPPQIISKYPILQHLNSCKSMNHLTQIHAQMITTGIFTDNFALSRILAFAALSPHGSIPYARLIFSKTRKPDAFMANTLIRSLAFSTSPNEALAFYADLLESSVVMPDVHTFPLLLKACSEIPSLSLGKAIHAHVYKMGFSSEVSVLNFLVQMYASCGLGNSAKLVFDRIYEYDDASWNIMLGGYLKLGELHIAHNLFDNMPERNVVSWSIMINWHVQNSHFKESWRLFREMLREKFEPNESVLVNVLSSCAHLGALEQGKWIEGYVSMSNITMTVRLGTALIDMYSKCGLVKRALEIFHNMREKNVLAWSSIINGLAINGQARQALDLFSQMVIEGIKPNEVTFIGILNACSHSRLVSEGCNFFESMSKVYKLKPNAHHYCCLVDLYGRAGMIKEAQNVIKTMPFKPTSAILGALLNACRIHGERELGETVGKKLLELEPNQSGRYVLLSNIYAASGKWDHVATLRRLMREKGINKTPGCSFIDLGGTIHEFIAGDNSHRESKMIYAKLDEMRGELNRAGYKFDRGQVLLDMDEEEKESAVFHHSEKLAIAFGLIKSDLNSTIRITKNLRVCLDCHSATKLLSKIYAREIIVRDRCRFHHFRDGSCSCMDFW